MYLVYFHLDLILNFSTFFNHEVDLMEIIMCHHVHKVDFYKFFDKEYHDDFNCTYDF